MGLSSFDMLGNIMGEGVGAMVMGTRRVGSDDEGESYEISPSLTSFSFSLLADLGQQAGKFDSGGVG